MAADRAIGAADRRTRVLSLAAGCVVWEAGARLAGLPFLPGCLETLGVLVHLVGSGLIFGNLSLSLGNLAVGFAAAAGAGVLAGTVMSRYQGVALVLTPYLHAALAAPGIIFVPILFTFFGTARITQVGAVFLNAVFLIAVTTAGALRPANTRLVAMASAFGATERQVFWKIRWPEARPLIFSGLRVGVLLGVKGMINGEMFIAFTGLGALVRTYGARFEPAGVLAILIVVIAVAFASTALIDLADRRVARAG